ncbi:hypothetical protein CNR22_03310 [Sphingobacteriaceae bacterium]|nr:hypothetical protein CNR22_03310 [Sphingobacteriaceae bacterium]
MKQTTRTLVVLLAIFFARKMNSQLSGTYAIPGTYTSIAAAISDLNSLGVSGPVIMNISAGYTETVVTGGFTLNAITGASSANTITFQKSGAGANPLVYAYTGTATPSSAAQDGVWRFAGSDYVTIDGLDITDLNTTNPGTMEFGYGFFKASVTDGCQNNTIRNCVISLSRVNNAAGTAPATDGSRGIDVVNATISAHTSVLTITSASGSNSNNKFYGNTIQNCNIGIAMIGFAASTPFTLADTGNDIGGNSAATGNTIINYGGGGTTASAGIRTLAQYNLNVAYNTVNNNNGAGLSHAGDLRGIYINTATSANASILSNTVTLKSIGTTALLTGIQNASGSTAASNTITISGNLVTNCSYTTATSGALGGIINSGTASRVNITNNILTNTTFTGTGTFTGIDGGGASGIMVNLLTNTVTANVHSGSNATFYCMRAGTASVTVSGNSVTNNAINATSGSSSSSLYGFYDISSPTYEVYTDNLIDNLTISGGSTATGHVIYGLYSNTSGSSVKTYSANRVSSLSIANGLAGGTIYGIFHALTGTTNIFKNKFYDFSAGGAAGVTYGIYVSSGALVSVYNNLVGDMRAPASNVATAVAGIYVNGGTTSNIYYNTVHLNASSTGTLFGSAALYSSTTPNQTLRNNILINLSTPVGTGLSVAYRRSSTTLTSYQSASNNNLLYAGATGTSNLIMYDGTNSYQTLAAFKTAVGSSDANSVTENTAFFFTTGPNANFLHINNTFTTVAESGGSNIAGITDDFDAQIRAGNSGYSGTGSAPDIGADENEPNLPTCTSVNAGTIGVTSYTRCSGQTIAINSAGTVLGGGTTFQWQESTTSGGPYVNVASGSGLNSPALTSGSLTAGTHYFVLLSTCPAISGTNISNEVTVLASPTPTANASIAGSNTVCAGSNLNLNGLTDVGTNFKWTGPNAFISTSQNAVVSSLNLFSGGIYTLVVSAGNCSVTVFSQNVTILSGPSILTVTPASASICSGSSQTIGVTGGLIPIFLTSGVSTNTNVNSSTTYPSPYSIYFGGQRFQFMVLASELTAAGFSANSAITGINLPITSFGSNWGSTRFDAQNFKVSIGATTATSLSAFITTLTTVYGPINYSPTIGYTNLHNFSSSFVWNGSDNIVIETAFSNNISGATADAVFTPTTATSFQSSISYRADNVTAATLYTTSTVSSSYNSRPDFKLYGLVQGTYNWSAGLSAATGASVTSTPAASSNYTVEVSYGTCSVTNVASVTVLNTPTVNLASTNTVLCGGASATLTASGASSYLWNTGATGSSIVIAPSTNSVYSIVGTNSPCPITGSANISITATNNPIVNISGSSGICTGQTASLAASGALTYLWNTGSTSDNITDTPAANTTYTVTGTDALGCSTTTTQLVTVAASLSISIVGPSTICLGQTAVLQGNGGVTYVWDGGATTASISINPTTNTTYSVIGSSGTCSNTAMLTVTVNANPAFSITGNTTICSGNTTTLTASGTAATYSWNTGAPTATAAVSPTANTTYTATGYSSAGCAVVQTVAVVSNSVPVILIASTASAVCVNSSATLTASGANTYTWITSGSPTTTALSVSPIATTIYTVNGTNAANCASSKTISITSNSLPVLSVAPASATVCALTAVNLTANGANSFTWSASGGSNSAASYTPASSTVYSVSGTNSLGCVGTSTVSVTTNTLPVISISPASATLCSLSPATFSASGANSYVWNGSTLGSTFTSISAASTVYSVTGYNASNCGATQTVAVIALPLPVIAVTPSFVTVCELSTGIYTVSGASTYVWQDNSTATTVAITPTGVTSFSVLGTDANGCTGQGSAVILTTPAPTLYVTPASVSVCPNTAQSFTAQGALTYTWSNGPNTATTSITPSTSGIYTVTGANGGGCTGTATVNITTKAVPVIAITPASASVCLNSPASFTAAGAATYTWNTGSNAADIFLTATTNTVFTVSGKNAIGCTASATVGLHVWQPPVINLTASSMTLCAKETVTLNAAGAATYTWYPFNVTGSVLTNAASNTFQYNIVGVDVNGCSNTASITVVVDKCTGIAKNSSLNNAVRMYPNPSTGVLNAEFDFDGTKNIIITNSTGATIAVMSTENRSESFNLSEMAKGVYFVKVTTSSASANYKIIVQ